MGMQNQEEWRHYGKTEVTEPYLGFLVADLVGVLIRTLQGGGWQRSLR